MLATPLDSAVLPPGIRSRFVPTSTDCASISWRPGSPRGPALRAAAARLSRTRLFLAQGHAGARRRRVPRRRARSARLWPHHRLEPPISTAICARSALLNAVRDALGLVHALGHRSVAAVVGHDFGSPVAAWCALVRPDVFRSVALMSAPFAGPPDLPSPPTAHRAASDADIHAALAALPRPRKHYQWYYSTRPANDDMWHCRQGVHAFLRAYYHHKSADWPATSRSAAGWTADELAKMPTYYIMDLDETMAETVAHGDAVGSRDRRLPLAARRRAGGLWRRIRSATASRAGCNGIAAAPAAFDTSELQLFAGRTIDVPSMFIAGSERLGHLPDARARSSACRRAPARAWSAAT